MVTDMNLVVRALNDYITWLYSVLLDLILAILLLDITDMQNTLVSATNAYFFDVTDR